jgi:hypothetical protein
MRKRVSWSCFVTLALVGSAFGQSAARYEVYGGYSFLREESVTNRHGWVGSFTRDFNDWLGVTGEAGGNYTAPGFVTHDRELMYSFLGGIHVAVPRKSRITPWAQFLVGPVTNRVTVFQFNGGAPPNLVRRTNTNFAIQPGGGFDFWLRPKLGIRVGGDYRLSFRQGSDLDSFRLHGGIVFKVGER